MQKNPFITSYCQKAKFSLVLWGHKKKGEDKHASQVVFVSAISKEA